MSPEYRGFIAKIQDWQIQPSLVELESLLANQETLAEQMTRVSLKGEDEVVFGVSAARKAEGEEKEKAIVSVMESLAFLEKQLEGKNFFGGEKIGYLDLVVGWIPYWLGVMEEVGDMKLLEKESFPLLHEWSQNVIHIPIIKNAFHPKKISSTMSVLLSVTFSH
nr:probable glutathione S-transferase [Ziziphus jujuba var. spinosa]